MGRVRGEGAGEASMARMSLASSSWHLRSALSSCWAWLRAATSLVSRFSISVSRVMFFICGGELLTMCVSVRVYARALDREKRNHLQLADLGTYRVLE